MDERTIARIKSLERRLEAMESLDRLPIRYFLDGWYQDNVVASQTNVLLERFNSSSLGADLNRVLPGRGGSVTGVYLRASEAVTAGTLTLTVFVGGSNTGFSVSITSGSNGRATQAIGLDTFTWSQQIDLRLTTDGSFTPTTLDVRGYLELTMNYDGGIN